MKPQRKKGEKTPKKKSLIVPNGKKLKTRQAVKTRAISASLPTNLVVNKRLVTGKNPKQGFGRLQIAPVAMTKNFRNLKPKFSVGNTDQSVRVGHIEYLGDLISSGNNNYIVLVDLPINPGIMETFPWLSSLAFRFEKYRFIKLRFVYLPEAATTMTGSVMLAVDFEAIDAAPASKVEFMSMKNAVRGAPYTEIIMDCDPEDLHQQNEYFVRFQIPPAGSDERLYDVGQFVLAINNTGVVAGLALGELYVEYEVELLVPTLEGILAAVDDGSITSTTGTGTRPFGASPTLDFNYTPPLIIATQNGVPNNVFTFTRRWDGVLLWQVVGTVLSGQAILTSGSDDGVLLLAVVNATATGTVSAWYCSFEDGGNVIPVITATTITASSMLFLPSTRPKWPSPLDNGISHHLKLFQSKTSRKTFRRERCILPRKTDPLEDKVTVLECLDPVEIEQQIEPDKFCPTPTTCNDLFPKKIDHLHKIQMVNVARTQYKNCVEKGLTQKANTFLNLAIDSNRFSLGRTPPETVETAGFWDDFNVEDLEKIVNLMGTLLSFV